MPTYRLWHRREKKYVPWGSGRGFYNYNSPYEALPDARSMNRAWGGTNDDPILELHTVDRKTGFVSNVSSLVYLRLEAL